MVGVYLPEERSVAAFLSGLRRELREWMHEKFRESGIVYNGPNSVILDSPESVVGPNGAIGLTDEINPDDPVINYFIDLSVAESEVLPEDFDYSGDMIFRLTMEALCVKRVVGNNNLLPLDDCHRILYWAANSFIGEGDESKEVGQRAISVPFDGKIERIIFTDAYGAPVDDRTRVAYRATWTVLFTYVPKRDNRILNDIVDRTFAQNVGVFIHIQPADQDDPDYIDPFTRPESLTERDFVHFAEAPADGDYNLYLVIPSDNDTVTHSILHKRGEAVITDIQTGDDGSYIWSPIIFGADYWHYELYDSISFQIATIAMKAGDYIQYNLRTEDIDPRFSFLLG